MIFSSGETDGHVGAEDVSLNMCPEHEDTKKNLYLYEVSQGSI